MLSKTIAVGASKNLDSAGLLELLVFHQRVDLFIGYGTLGKFLDKLDLDLLLELVKRGKLNLYFSEMYFGAGRMPDGKTMAGQFTITDNDIESLARKALQKTNRYSNFPRVNAKKLALHADKIVLPDESSSLIGETLVSSEKAKKNLKNTLIKVPEGLVFQREQDLRYSVTKGMDDEFAKLFMQVGQMVEAITYGNATDAESLSAPWTNKLVPGKSSKQQREEYDQTQLSQFHSVIFKDYLRFQDSIKSGSLTVNEAAEKLLKFPEISIWSGSGSEYPELLQDYTQRCADAIVKKPSIRKQIAKTMLTSAFLNTIVPEPILNTVLSMSFEAVSHAGQAKDERAFEKSVARLQGDFKRCLTPIVETM